MIVTIISPAKKLNYRDQPTTRPHTQPALIDHTKELLPSLKTLSPQDICSLMGLSDKLAALNYERFQAWHTPFTLDNAKQAILAFAGDVYQGLDANRMTDADLAWAQGHLRILSGLYGVLRPLDLMQPYRLEMGTKFANSRGSTLYQFWGNIITSEINQLLEGQAKPVLLNLASNEYFKSIQLKHLAAPLITPVFMDKKGDQYRTITFYAKRARGRMSHFIIKNRMTDVEDIKYFDLDSYRYNAAMSDSKKWVFTRPSPLTKAAI